MSQRDAARGTGATTARSTAGARVRPDVPAAPTPPTPTPSVAPPPPPDARAVARAGLAAGRSPSLWWACTGIVVVLVVTFAVGATQGALALAALLGASAVARAVLRPGPVALTVRSRWLDTAVLAGLAVGLALLAELVPTR